MLLRICALLTFLVSTSLLAKEVVVVSRNSVFKVKYDASGVSVKGPQIDLNLVRSDCNSDIIEVFVIRMNNAIRSNTLQKVDALGHFKFILDGDEYFESYHSKRGNMFLMIPKEVQRMKLEENELCGSK